MRARRVERAAAVALVATFAIATPVFAFTAQNSMRVEPRGGTDFHIPYTARSSPRAFWCAAGDYAIRVLQVSSATRIYRTTAPPRRSGEGMSFSLDPARATAPGLLRLSRSPGLTAANARFQCELSSAEP